MLHSLFNSFPEHIDDLNKYPVFILEGAGKCLNLEVRNKMQNDQLTILECGQTGTNIRQTSAFVI